MFALLLALLFAVPGGPPAWQAIDGGVHASLRGLDVHGEVIWASGSGGTWLRSPDGGKTWAHGVVAGAETLDFRGVYAFDDRTALMISSGPAEKGQARIVRTTDGGEHWTEVFRGSQPGMFLDAIKFWDEKHGIVLSDPVEGKYSILRSDDGGVTWHAAPRDRMPDALPNEGAFAASNSALAVWGTKDAWFGTGGAWRARVFVSHDRGRSWTDVVCPIAAGNASSGVFSVAFADGKHGVAVGGDYQKPAASSKTIALTNDGGASWNLATSPLDLYLSGVAVYRDRMIAVGSAGWAASTGGKDWKAVHADGLNAVALMGNTAIAVGPDGRIATLEFGDSDSDK